MIRGHSRAQEVRDGDCGDDQYDGDDDQKLDQRKTGLLILAPSPSCDFSRTFSFSLLKASQKKGRKPMTSSLPFPSKTLLQRRLPEVEHGAHGPQAASCCRVNTNDARLIDAVRCGSGRQREWSGANREACVARSSASCRNTRGQGQHAVRRVSVLVTAFLVRGGRQHFVNQLRIVAGSYCTRRAAQLRESYA